MPCKLLEQRPFIPVIMHFLCPPVGTDYAVSTCQAIEEKLGCDSLPIQNESALHEMLQKGVSDPKGAPQPRAA